jgi:hypothetical protein
MVYFLAGTKGKWYPLASGLVDHAASARCLVDLPAIVRMELLVEPYRSSNRSAVGEVRYFMNATPGFRSAPMIEDMLVVGARVRATKRISTPDALVIASATVRQCDTLVGNDKDFLVLRDAGFRAALPDLQLPRYIHLDDFVD